eukprot:COSAG01_NODE_258_length_20077_cov_124.162429_28_plen_130_part_00
MQADSVAYAVPSAGAHLCCVTCGSGTAISQACLDTLGPAWQHFDGMDLDRVLTAAVMCLPASGEFCRLTDGSVSPNMGQAINYFAGYLKEEHGIFGTAPQEYLIEETIFTVLMTLRRQMIRLKVECNQR